MKDISVYLKSILNTIERIEDFKARGVDDDLTSKALMYELVTIGEAVMKVPSGLRDKYPEIIWSDIVAFRNVLVHGYLGVNMDAVNYVVENELELLKQTVTQMLKETPNG